MFEARPYQLEAVRWFLNDARGRGIIADDMGLGKTGEAYTVWKQLGFPKPALLLAGKNAQVAWLNQAADWGCSQPVLIRGTAAQRKKLWEQHKAGFVSITRESLKKDLLAGIVPQFKFIVVDECHKDSNRKTGNYKLLKKLAATAQYVLLMSGSIARRGPQSLWGPLNVVASHAFPSYWKFLNRYCIVQQGQWGMEILGPQNVQELKEVLRNHLIRRTKAEVRPEMPPKTRDLTSNVIAMSPRQADMYNQIREEGMLLTQSENIVVTPSVLAKITRMRQLLVTPKLLDPGEEYGAGIERVIELLDDADDRHMAIFTPFASALPFIRDRLTVEGFKPEDIFLLRGGMSVEELMQSLNAFRDRKGIAVCSIKFAESFDLIPATWGIFLGYEWDAWENLQAEDRLHRGEIVNPVTYYYISYSEGIDTELMMPALDTKVNNAMAVLRDIEKVRQLFSKPVHGMHG